MTFASRVSDLAVAIRTKINTMTPRLMPAGGLSGQALAKTAAGDFVTGWAYTGQAGPPTARTVVLATAYQASAPAKAAIVTVNLTSTASLSLTGGSTNAADIVIGPAATVAAGTGTAIAKYANSNTGTLTIGLALSTIAAAPVTFALPAGWFFAVRQTSGMVTITSAFDQAIG